MRIIKGARGNITGHFGDTGVPGAHVPKHLGMDIGHGNKTAADLRVGAPAAGRIISAGWLGTYGNHIQIDHGYDENGDHWTSLLGHLESFNRSSGTVDEDEDIAVMGDTGGDWPTHLHQELRRNGIPVNPEDYLTAAPAGGDSKPVNNNEEIDMDETGFYIRTGGSAGQVFWYSRSRGTKRAIKSTEWDFLLAASTTSGSTTGPRPVPTDVSGSWAAKIPDAK
ncbi:MAG: peptidoglycan DD-metalloendopeptidase family protein [Leifsonia sp.]